MKVRECKKAPDHKKAWGNIKINYWVIFEFLYDYHGRKTPHTAFQTVEKAVIPKVQDISIKISQYQLNKCRVCNYLANPDFMPFCYNQALPFDVKMKLSAVMQSWYKKIYAYFNTEKHGVPKNAYWFYGFLFIYRWLL